LTSMPTKAVSLVRRMEVVIELGKDNVLGLVCSDIVWRGRRCSQSRSTGEGRCTIGCRTCSRLTHTRHLSLQGAVAQVDDPVFEYVRPRLENIGLGLIIGLTLLQPQSQTRAIKESFSACSSMQCCHREQCTRNTFLRHPYPSAACRTKRYKSEVFALTS
jgi:hypothetical protein